MLSFRSDQKRDVGKEAWSGGSNTRLSVWDSVSNSQRVRRSSSRSPLSAARLASHAFKQGTHGMVKNALFLLIATLLLAAPPALPQTGLPTSVTDQLQADQGHRRLLQAIGYTARNAAAANALRQGREAARAHAQEEMARTGGSSVAITVRTWEYSGPTPNESVFSEYRYSFGLSGSGASDDEALGNMVEDKTGSVMEGPSDGRSLWGVMVYVFRSGGGESVYSPAAVSAVVKNRNASRVGSSVTPTNSSTSSSGTSSSSGSSGRRHQDGDSWKADYDRAWSTASDSKASDSDREKAQHELNDLLEEARHHADTAMTGPDLGDGSPHPVLCGACGLILDMAKQARNVSLIDAQLEGNLFLNRDHYLRKGERILPLSKIH
jgi:ribosomal protein L21E